MMTLLHSDLVADFAVWMIVFMVEAMQLPLGQLAGSALRLCLWLRSALCLWCRWNRLDII